LAFDEIQPVSGPFRPPAQAGIAFRFLDTLSTVVSSGSASTSGIGMIQVALWADSDDVNVGRLVFAGESHALMSIGLRNRIR
jgi:hypothetical protein